MRKAEFERSFKKKRKIAESTKNLLCSCQSSGKKIEKTKEIRNAPLIEGENNK